MASLLLAEDQLEELTAVLDGIAGGAAPGNITAGKLRSLASSAHRAASRLQAFEDKQYSRAEQQAANKLFKQAVHMSSSDDSSDDDAATTLDQAAVDELREAGNASFKAKDTVEAARSWSKAAAMLKAAGKPDAKLLSNIAAAHLAGDKFVAAAHHAAESVDADPDWWKGHWYRGQALQKMVRNNFGPPRHRRCSAAWARLICAQVRNKPPPRAMGERRAGHRLLAARPAPRKQAERSGYRAEGRQGLPAPHVRGLQTTVIVTSFS